MENLLLCTVKICSATDADRNNCFQVMSILLIKYNLTGENFIALNDPYSLLLHLQSHDHCY